MSDLDIASDLADKLAAASAEIERLQTQCAALEHYGAVMRAATIEECALMAEHYKFDPLEYYNNGLAKKYIAAAIRALAKEQT